MRDTRLIMGMPVTVEILHVANASDLETVFLYFTEVDARFSTYKPDSEISRINRGELDPREYSPEMREVFQLAEKTKRESNGYFDIGPVGTCDPSGLVKGWAIHRAAELLLNRGHKDFYLDVGGDVAAYGHNQDGQPWRVGIRNPFKHDEIVKIVQVSGQGVATSGTYERGEHIYNPKTGKPAAEIASLTVIGPTIYEADRFATAAFAMGRDGIRFIEDKPGLAGYMIDKDGTATMTSNFENYLAA